MPAPSTNPRSSPNPVAWLDRHGDLLFRFAISRVRDRATAEDLVQETLLAAIQSVEAHAAVSSERGWLMGILRHKLGDHFRRCAREQRLWEHSGDVPDTDGEFDDSGHWTAAFGDWESPETSLEQDEFWATLNRCVDALPQNLKTTFALREIDGVGCDDLAETLGITKNNLWVMLSRARQRMRDCLERHWFNG